jgi:hypothetical protein
VTTTTAHTTAQTAGTAKDVRPSAAMRPATPVGHPWPGSALRPGPGRVLAATRPGESDPAALMQAVIKAKAGAAALTRVQQYLTQTGHPHAEVYTKLAADAAFLYRYDLSVQDWRFAEVNPGVLVPELVDQKEIDNSSAATVSEQFSYTKTTTDTFAFSFTEGLKVGVSAKFKAGIPVAGTEWTVSGELSFSATQTQTTTTTNTWSNTVTANVPAHTKVRAVAFVSVGSPQYTFSASAVVDNGMVQIPTWNSTAKSYDDLLIPLEVLLPTNADRSIPLAGALAAQCGVRSYVQLDTIS